MKYMGSKRWMLKNGLGHLISEKLAISRRFVDLFCGSGTVAHYAASLQPAKVIAFDLQYFCAALADSVVSRKSVLADRVKVFEAWQRRAADYLANRHRAQQAVQPLPELRRFVRKYVEEVRDECASLPGFRITQAYGGHYFSKQQALWIDALRASLPRDPAERAVALAALLQGAMQCTAGPGHTAQPFQPTRGAKKFLFEAWGRDVVIETSKAFEALAVRHARAIGRGSVADANAAADTLREGDLVFIDPPYSGVHYSRFYHVLETIAKGTCSVVTGIGRYPPISERPQSRYSLRTESPTALDDLLSRVSASGARALLTFPRHKCSNGLGGDLVADTASRYFKVSRKLVENRFSTLGGTQSVEERGNGRAARQKAQEIIFLLEPR